eukprot:TRINITY_DN10365_c0_g1_i1.p1 TRINITY_DN10365_c0_g1~~TRINITY_DN10365_c0_g1_i1.p1  ORF type:complete len:309 (+),score=63.63 TRINITY_DN10365_c0_g1_i1:35-928(+)
MALAAYPEEERIAYEATSHGMGVPVGLADGSDRLPVEREDILDGRGILLRHFLSPSECEWIIRHAEAIGLEPTGYDTAYRNNDRVAVRSEEVARWLWERAAPLLQLGDREVRPDRHYDFRYQGNWRPFGVNEVFRLCKYHPGGHFSPHYDGDFQRSPDERSFKTFMIYLNGGFEGGSTNFLRDNLPLAEYTRDSGRLYLAPPEFVQYRLQPEQGMLICFDTKVLHEGDALRTGSKYLMRSDVMYRRQEGTAPVFSDAERRAFQLLEEAEKLEGERREMEAVELYRRAYKLCPHLEGR